MGGKKRRDFFAAERVGDKEMGGCGRCCFERLYGCADFFKCAREAFGVASKQRARRVSEKFAFARDREFDEFGDEGGEDEEEKAHNHKKSPRLSAAAIAIPSAMKKSRAKKEIT